MHSSSADIYASASHVHSTFFSASRLSRVVFLNDHKTACSILFLVAPLYSLCRHIFFLLCRQREDGTVASLLLFFWAAINSFLPFDFSHIAAHAPFYFLLAAKRNIAAG
jgi:hypothetical protein